MEVAEKEYSPTTMYEDYALNEFLFHKKILLFVREQNKDEYGLAMSYVFLGEAGFVKSYGARPMSIEWRLVEPIPAGLLKESRKLVG